MAKSPFLRWGGGWQLGREPMGLVSSCSLWPRGYGTERGRRDKAVH